MFAPSSRSLFRATRASSIEGHVSHVLEHHFTPVLATSAARHVIGCHLPQQTRDLRGQSVMAVFSTQFRPRIKWSHLLLAKMVQIEPCLYVRLVFHILNFSTSTV